MELIGIVMFKEPTKYSVTQENGLLAHVARWTVEPYYFLWKPISAPARTRLFGEYFLKTGINLSY